MISINHINAIAKYERKTLLRSWFFRIFAILSILFIAIMNIVILISPWSQGAWIVRAIPANIPYINLLLLNVVQAIIAIFLASDFLKQDSKLDTTDVIYVRSMSNIDYVIGKTLGNCGVFVILNIIMLAITLVINIFSPSSGVNAMAYLYYFLLISIPTLVFIMGLSFLLMSVLKNQAVTFIILLGYIAISLFYLQSKYYYIFDYMAYSIPMTYSDFVGFGNLSIILNHRGMYLFLGLSFIGFTVVKLKRLSHSKQERTISCIVASLLLMSSIYMGYNHINRVISAKKIRKEMVEHNDLLAKYRPVSVSNYDINIKHNGKTISAKAKLSIKNKEQNAIDTIIFSLNEQLKIDSLLINNQKVDFKQKLGTVLIKNKTLKPKESAELTFIYSGTITESSAYLDINEKDIEDLRSEFLFKIDKRSSFLTKNYVLLTRESTWYPVPGASFGKQNQKWLMPQFSNYKLTVETKPNLTVISQGSEEIIDNKHIFTSSHANSQISLVIGDYTKIKQNIDGLDFNIYIHKNHDYFSSFFESVKDTIPTVMAEILQDYERSIDLYYPFERFSLVEVPIQYYSYNRLLSSANENIQPEQVFITEKAATLERADINEAYNEMNNQTERGFRRRNSAQMTEEEKRIQIFRDFVGTFFSSTGRPDFQNDAGEFKVSETKNTYYVFPMFYDRAYSINSEKWPISNKIFSAYKADGAESNGNMWMQNMQGTTNDEKANIALLSNSFEDLLKNPDKNDIIDYVIELKGTTLFSVIKHKVGEKQFDDFFYNFLYKYKFKTANLENFALGMKSEFDIDLIPYMEQWFKTKKLPTYIFSKVDAKNVLDNDELKTMVSFKVTNTEAAEGVIKLEFRTGGGPRRQSNSTDNVTKLIHLDKNQTKEVSMLISGSPRGGTINTLTSKNIPSNIEVNFGRLEEDKTATAIEGEWIVADPVKITDPSEIVVDNEDSGFRLTETNNVSRLRKWLLSSKLEDEKYQSFNEWRPKINWTLTTNSNFYGSNIRSAYYIASGAGDQIAEWNAKLDGEGFYDVYVYLYKGNRWNRQEGVLNYTLHHADGTEIIPIESKNGDNDWYHLGAYYFVGDSTKIELTNKSKSRLVIADAIKLVKQ